MNAFLNKHVLRPMLLYFWTINSLVGQLTLGPMDVATANTYATQARGDDVIGLNPANLGFNNNPSFSISFGVIPLIPVPNLKIGNNAISPSWLNREFFNRGFLNEAAVNELLTIFPDRGWSLNPLSQMKMLGLSFGSYAISIVPEIHSAVNIPKPLMNLIFKGTRFHETIDISDLQGTIQVLIPITLAYGYELDFATIDYIVEQSYLGAGIKLIGGVGYATTEKVKGTIISEETGITTQGEGVLKSAKGGYGLAFDIGFAVIISKGIRVNAALNNLLGYVKWSDNNAEMYHFVYDADIKSDQMEEIQNYNSTQKDSLINSYIVSETKTHIKGFKTPYPAYLLAGIQFDEIIPSIDLFINYRQYFQDNYYISTIPRISIGYEYQVVKWLTIRNGYSSGGKERFQWGIGFGLHRRHYRLNFGFSQDGGVFNYAKGFSIALEQKLVY